MGRHSTRYPAEVRGRAVRLLEAASVRHRHVVPPSRFVPSPAAAPNAANITDGGVGDAPGPPKRRDPDSRVMRACAPAPAGARFAAARIARLIARARLRARGGRRAHLARRLNRGLFAPAPTRREAASGYRVLPPYLGPARSKIKLFPRNISDYENNLRATCRKGPRHRPHSRQTGRPGVLSREAKTAHSPSVNVARPSRSTGR